VSLRNRIRVLGAFALLFAVGVCFGLAQTYQRGTTHNPHGPLKTPCESCHTSTSWKPIRSFPDFDHNKTRYPLRGMHEKVECGSCHVKLVFKDVGTKCADCHADLHRGQFGARCEDCHTVKGWNVTIRAVKEHQNRFPLLGAHAAVDCASCHVNAAVGQFAGLRTDCVSCHLQDYQNTKSSGLDHTALNFSTTCESCHGVDSWFGASFDHAKVTGFSLVGAHSKLMCTACHIGGRFQGTPADCYSCHINDYKGTSNPNHVAAGFPTTCQTCHNTISWQGARFDHNTFTKFPLTGAHITVPCSSCHIGNKFAGTPTNCYGCHQKDYQGTTNPNHVSAGFPTDCSVCHSTVNWNGANFNHATTGFSLTGAHTTLACQSCHVNNNYALTDPTCKACHMPNYTATTNPNHVTAGFPTTCETCHNTSSWAGATFNHNNTPFPLTGAHVSVPCTSCHINNVFAGTPTDCYSCHKVQYQGTTSPNHVAAGFPTTCQTCHTTASWLGATFNHTWFQIPHHNAQCSDCHSNSSNYTIFVCTNCHTQAATDPRHQGVQGYVWNSANCYSCHKQ
jgi:hypothetical protein